MKSAYGRTIPSEDAELTHVGPGTPMGELFRRYWQPVAVSDELTYRPQRLRILGEDLVVFRDLEGHVGLLDLHCSHRGTSLEWGRVERRGLRCCYHGWLYDVQGRVVEMPCEPDSYADRRGLEHPAYPVMEFGGLVFAYMGPPDKLPLFPMLDIYDTRHRGDIALKGMRIWGEYFVGFVRDCNWLQATENVVDPWHLFMLHTQISGAQFQGALGVKDVPRIDFEETPLGVRYVLERELPNGNRLIRHSELILPNIILIPSIYEDGSAAVDCDKPSEVTWAIPVDDAHVTCLSMVAWPLRDGAPDPAFKPRTNTVIPERPGSVPERSYDERQRRPDDREAQEGQRPIAVHALENLVSSDRGVSMFRRELRKSLELIRAGQDPANIMRDPERNHALETSAYNRVIVPTSALGRLRA